MPSLIHLKRRMRSAKNISQITKAMEMVAASKMRKAQEKVLQSRPYAEKLDEIIGNVGALTKSYAHPLLEKRMPIQNVAVLVLSTNKGLCGSLNTNLFRAVSEWRKTLPKEVNITFVTAGKKASNHIHKTNLALLAEFSDLPENPSFENTRPVSKLLMDGYTAREYDQVYVIYTRFISTLQQRVAIKQILPAERTELFEAKEEGKEMPQSKEYLFEPNAKGLMDWIIPYRFELITYQTILDAKASEYSARMVSMKNAHDNAEELIGGLTLDYNQVRQTKVTNELLDVTTARLALGA